MTRIELEVDSLRELLKEIKGHAEDLEDFDDRDDVESISEKIIDIVDKAEDVISDITDEYENLEEKVEDLTEKLDDIDEDMVNKYDDSHYVVETPTHYDRMKMDNLVSLYKKLSLDEIEKLVSLHEHLKTFRF